MSLEIAVLNTAVVSLSLNFDQINIRTMDTELGRYFPFELRNENMKR
jgi:hypothetical protein